MIFAKHTHQDMTALGTQKENPKFEKFKCMSSITFTDSPPSLTFNAILKVTFFSTKIRHNSS